MFNLLPGSGLGFAGSKQIALGLGAVTGEIVIPPVVEPKPEIPSTGGGGRYDPGYVRQREDALLETRRRRILAEDEEISAMIMAMITKSLI